MRNIILEGPDNAGKSTLARFLSEALDLPIKHSGGPSKHPGEVNERAHNFNNDAEFYIYDRHPCVSQNIYQQALKTNGELVEQKHIQAFYDTKPLIIYCRSLGNLDGHEQSEHSSIEYFQQVEKSYTDLCAFYDHWALTKANIIYRIGDDMERLLSLVTQTLEEDIRDFHEKFQLTYNEGARFLPDDLQSFRSKFLEEETLEYYEGVAERDMIKQADSLGDNVYVAIGTAYLSGHPFQRIWNLIHRANMRKVRALRASDSKRGSTYDVVKPEGWTKPDMRIGELLLSTQPQKAA